MSAVGAKSFGHSAFSAAQLLSMQIATVPLRASIQRRVCFSKTGEFMAVTREREDVGERNGTGRSVRGRERRAVEYMGSA